MRRLLETRWLLALMLIPTLIVAIPLLSGILSGARCDPGISIDMICVVLAAISATASSCLTASNMRSNRTLRAALAEAERTAQQLRTERAQLLGAFEVMPEPVILLDAEDRAVMWNHRYARNSLVATGRGDFLRPGLRFEDL